MAQKKESPEKKAQARGSSMKGESYLCESCGLVVTVDEPCGCVDVCDIMCCNVPMKKTGKPRVKAAK